MKKPNFVIPTQGTESIYFKLVSDLDASGFMETKYKMAKYTSVTYKHGSAYTIKSKGLINTPSCIETEEHTNPSDRVSYKKWERKPKKNDQNVKNWD